MQKSRWNKIKNGLSSAGNKIRNNSEQIKKAGETVAGTIFGGGTVENLRQITKDKKKGIKGLAKAGLVIGVMVAVGILAAPLVGPLAAAVFAISAGVATPRIASSFGSKGMQYNSKERQAERTKDAQDVDKLKAKIQEKQKAFEKSASQKKKLGIGAIGAALIITFLTGGAALLVLLGAFAIGAVALKSSSTDKKKAADIPNIDKESNLEKMQKAAVTAGIFKQKDLDSLKDQGQEEKKGQEASVQNNGQDQEKKQGQVDGKGQSEEEIFYDARSEEKQHANQRSRSKSFSEPSGTNLLKNQAVKIVKEDIKRKPSVADLKRSESELGLKGKGLDR